LGWLGHRDPPTNEFEGPLNQIIARQEAERRFGPGGALFREVVHLPVVSPKQPEGCKISVLH